MLPGPADVVQDRKQLGQHVGERLLADGRPVALHPLAVVGVLGLQPLQVGGALRQLGLSAAAVSSLAACSAPVPRACPAPPAGPPFPLPTRRPARDSAALGRPGAAPARSGSLTCPVVRVDAPAVADHRPRVDVLGMSSSGGAALLIGGPALVDDLGVNDFFVRRVGAGASPRRAGDPWAFAACACA